jgi:biopolymer transport protein ExbD
VDKPPKAFDVWFVAANTVYKGVPYQVVADWVGEGRLTGTDMVRPAGTTEAWAKIEAVELLRDYLPRPVQVAAGVGGEPEELDHEPRVRRSRGDDDDEVDMIPLIDISMVLLVFFIMLRASGAVSPVDVPDMRFAGELSKNASAITVNIEKDASGTLINYSVRIGEAAARPEHSGLKDSGAAVKTVAEVVADLPRPREVRIACEKDLPSKVVADFLRDLTPVKDRYGINLLTAEVNEAPKQ